MSRQYAELIGGPKRLLDIAELGYYLSLGRSTVYTLVDAGEIPKLKIGAKTVFDVRDADAYVERVKRAS